MSSRRSPLAAKAHASRIRERKKYIAREYGPMPVSKGKEPKARGAHALRIEMDKRARLFARDRAKWQARIDLLPLEEVRIGLR